MVQFLPERISSIAAQSVVDWECIILDGFSNDGSWPILEDWAASDERVRASQAAPQGIYAAWNCMIQQSAGEFIYIAPSDDTMAPDCLERMVEALETHPDYDICQCGLQMIDREGNPMTGADGGLCWEKLGNASYFGDQLKAPHVRKAPHDGLVALAYGTVWTSMTQVLIRRTLFDKVGLFPTNWDAVGDAAWQMKASLVANVVYIPEKLATWRYYEGQGSGRVHQKALEEGWMHQMGLDALEWFDGINPALAKKIRRSGILDFFLISSAHYQWKASNGLFNRLLFVARNFHATVLLAVRVVKNRFGLKAAPKNSLVRRVTDVVYS
jgi:glycosyltransferase involved in cell wall biosynthesis